MQEYCSPGPVVRGALQLCVTLGSDTLKLRMSTFPVFVTCSIVQLFGTEAQEGFSTLLGYQRCRNFFNLMKFCRQSNRAKNVEIVPRRINIGLHNAFRTAVGHLRCLGILEKYLPRRTNDLL